MKTNDILSEKQKLILELLKSNNIDKLKDFINSLKTPLYFLNSTNFDLLTLALSLNCTFYIIKLIYNRCNYKTLNYVVKDIYHLYDMSNHKDETIVNYQNSLEVLMDSNNNVKSPLLVSLEFSDFQSVEFLINKGADMYFKINGKYILEILREENLLTMRKLNFLLKNGFSLKNLRLNDSAILNLNILKTGISKRKFNHRVNNEINKIEIPMELYLKYLDRKDYKKVEYLYKYYGTEKTRSFKDFIIFYLNYFDRNYNKKSFYDFFNFIINNENTFPFSKEYAINENETIIINKKLKIVELIKNNNNLKLETFLKNNNYILHCLYSSKSEILNLINEYNVSSDIVDILRNIFY
ncbi:hypothetical protein LY90DRAFT_518655 [Neocallimastix californiae]|uniref:Ankyrin n=1 Tax=Neocallimastix californiae TaxID=1754190 RepID=A0A1Y1ZL78_9FUNG|nr:hypothetical protein LY90DRAFT_518655 [Neocallimastix californiae]|eukprot:ORY10595.1 hypothetical protein LY90DRAFT_518655 [Neocallimastix californiae]